MKYLSVCSGIEAATVAWHPLGWKPVAFSEIEPFPCKVLAHHYPDVPNLGDMTKFNQWSLNESIDLLVGGTPCQSFSVAGLRQGLKDPRGNLMLTYLAIADKFKPEWIVWENVPGVLSSNNGRDFAAFLEGLAELGYGWAYRVLDAQHCRTHDYPAAVPQRRMRVFVVGCLGGTERAAKVLFEPESVLGNPAPSREKGEEVAKCLTRGIGTRFDSETDTFAIAGNIIGRQPENGGNVTGYSETGVSYTLTKTDIHGVAYNDSVCGTLNASGAGTNRPAGQGNELDFLAVAFKIRGECEVGGKGTGYSETTDVHAVAFQLAGDRDNPSVSVSQELAFCIPANPMSDRGQAVAFGGDVARTLSRRHDSMQVRRLTPTECERLQGFPDGYTDIPGASDSSRYKALGNSMAVNVMQLIGTRIQMLLRGELN